MTMHPDTSFRPRIARRPFRWVLVGAMALAPLAACVSADGALAPPDCEEPPLVPVDTIAFPDSVRPPPPTNPQPGTPVCKPDDA